MDGYGMIYKATSPSGKIYIGKTIQTLKERKRKHKIDSKKYTHAFANAINKYGIHNFKWNILLIFLFQLYIE